MNPQKFPNAKRKKIKIMMWGILMMFTKSRNKLSAGSFAPSGITATVIADIKSNASYV